MYKVTVVEKFGSRYAIISQVGFAQVPLATHISFTTLHVLIDFVCSIVSCFSILLLQLNEISMTLCLEHRFPPGCSYLLC